MMQSFVSDYMEGAVPEILERLSETNFIKTQGYGRDEFTESAVKKIKAACGSDDLEVFLLAGGTQTNKTVISALLKPYEGVLAADTAHIEVHEAGAIERGGHKVISLASKEGKICAVEAENYLRLFYADANYEHMVRPGMIYISQPTEYGTLYSLNELRELREVCGRYDMKLFVDGARLGYALAAKENDVSLSDLARLTDVFYIGGTKCGALLGEAVVMKKGLIPHFFTMIKQEGALLAKGRLPGIQFDTLFTDGLYERICKNAVELAMRIKSELIKKGYELYIDSPTNQQFVLVDRERLAKLEGKVEYGFMENIDEEHAVIRFCTSWASRAEDVEELLNIL